MTGRCPVCHRRQRILCLSGKHVFNMHWSGSRACSGSGREAAS